MSASLRATEQPGGIEAEISVLGGMLIDPGAIPSALERVDAAMFARPAHQILFRAMEKLHEAGTVIDVITLGDALKESNELEAAGGQLYLAELLDAVPTAANIEYHAEIVARHGRQRREDAERFAISDGLSTGTLSLSEALERLHVILSSAAASGAKAMPAPMGIAELLAVEDPEDSWLVPGLFPTSANILLAAYPKSYKTFLLLELAVSLAASRSFLGAYPPAGRFRVGLVLMEDQAHRVRRRIERICRADGIDPATLDGWLYIWFRPPLRLDQPEVVAELAALVEERGLAFLGVDSWAYVAGGDSNDSDQVAPQLNALSGLRERAPGLSVCLTHHARKDQQGGKGAERLTDKIRNSSHFGAWYDTGVHLARKDEQSPVNVRLEHRDLPSPAPFAFTVEDEHAGGLGTPPSGYLRIRKSEHTSEELKLALEAKAIAPKVREFLAKNPGCSKRALRAGIEARSSSIDAAFTLLESAREVRFEEPLTRGKSGSCWLETDTVPDRAPTVPRAHPGGTVPTVPQPPKGGGSGRTPPSSFQFDRAPNMDGLELEAIEPNLRGAFRGDS